MENDSFSMGSCNRSQLSVNPPQVVESGDHDEGVSPGADGLTPGTRSILNNMMGHGDWGGPFVDPQGCRAQALNPQDMSQQYQASTMMAQPFTWPPPQYPMPCSTVPTSVPFATVPSAILPQPMVNQGMLSTPMMGGFPQQPAVPYTTDVMGGSDVTISDQAMKRGRSVKTGQKQKQRAIGDRRKTQKLILRLVKYLESQNVSSIANVLEYAIDSYLCPLTCVKCDAEGTKPLDMFICKECVKTTSDGPETFWEHMKGKGGF